MQRERVAHYRIEKLLGAGGMGEVHAAFDEKLERRVAIKMLPAAKSANEDARARMLREARAASALQHPGIVGVHEIGEADGATYIVMELVEGETFAERITRLGTLPAAEAVALVAEVADALGAAHDAGILHRDIKTANLMIDKRGKVRVLDFGLSKRVGALVSGEWAGGNTDRHQKVDVDAPTEIGAGTPPASADPVTAYGARMGTPGYAALELITGGEADVRSDVFSLGVVLHELVTGKRPFVAETFGELEDLMRASNYRRSGHARLDAVIAKALAPKRDDRWASAEAMVSAARAAVIPARRRTLAIVTLGGVAVAGVAAAIAIPRFGGSAANPVDAAVVPDAPPASPADLAARRPLTTLGGCASAPTFLDDHTVVFTYEHGGPADLWTVDLDGGPPRELVASPHADWRPAPGRKPGEVVYLVDTGDPDTAAIVARDLVGGAETLRFVAFSAGVAAIGDAIYYTSDNGSSIRRRVGDHDEVLFTMPRDAGASTLTASPTGDRLGLDTKRPGKDSQACVLQLGATPALDCTGPATSTRVGFGPDGALYYARGASIGAFRPGLPPTSVVDAPARDLAVAPDGRSLVYSDCAPTSSIVVLGAEGRTFLDERTAMTPVAGPGGRLAWVSRGGGMKVRNPDGAIIEVVDRSMGAVSYPSFSADGKWLVFGLAGPAPGIYQVSIAGGAPQQVVDGHDDEQPVYVDDDRRIMFTRYDEGGVAHALIVETASTDPPRAVTPRTRYVLDANHATGEVLLLSDVLSWFDPRTNKERPGPELQGSGLFQASVSPSGTWLLVQTGSLGLSFWTMPLKPGARLEHLVDLPADQAVSRATIDDDGAVIAAPQVYRGELFVVPARAGARY